MNATLESIYHDHSDYVWRNLLRLGVERDDVLDATQDVFLIVHEQLDRFEGRCAITTWLFTICRTVAHRRRILAKRRRDQLTEGDVDTAIDLRADVGRAAEHNQDLILLASILERLEPEQRNVFILFELERMTGEDIAVILGIPIGTVYSRLQLARSAFRQALARHEAKSQFAGMRAGGGS